MKHLAPAAYWLVVGASLIGVTLAALAMWEI